MCCLWVEEVCWFSLSIRWTLLAFHTSDYGVWLQWSYDFSSLSFLFCLLFLWFIHMHGGCFICIPLRNGFLYYTFYISSQRLGCSFPWLYPQYWHCRCIDIVAVLTLALSTSSLLVEWHLSFYSVNLFYYLFGGSNVTHHWCPPLELIEIALSSIVWIMCSKIRSSCVCVCVLQSVSLSPSLAAYI